MDLPASTWPKKITLTCSLPYISCRTSSSISSACSFSRSTTGRPGAGVPRDGDARPDEGVGDVLPDPPDNLVGSPVFSTLGAVVSAPMDNTFAFGAGAASPEILSTFALGASLLGAVGGAGEAASAALSPAAGLFAI